MRTPLTMLLLWLVFAAGHIGVVASPIRERLVRRYGKARWVVGFVVLSQALFAPIPIYYATHQHEGPAGPALGALAGARPVLIGLLVAGLLLIVGALSPRQYVASNPFGTEVRQPLGLERITRHPIFVGLAMWSIAHALLSTRLIGTMFFSGFAAVGLLGTMRQERKHRREKGAGYEQFLETTSVLPFAAVLAGRQSIRWGELPWVFLALGAGVVWLLRVTHADLMGLNGVGFVLFFAAATTYFTLATLPGAKASLSR